MAKFRRRMSIIDAHQCENGMQVTTSQGILFANPGDWVIKDENGLKTTCSPEEFPLLFESVSEEEVAEMEKKVAVDRARAEAKKVAEQKKAYNKARIKNLG